MNINRSVELNMGNNGVLTGKVVITLYTNTRDCNPKENIDFL